MSCINRWNTSALAAAGLAFGLSAPADEIELDEAEIFFELRVRARIPCHLASHLHHISGRSASSEILEIARLFLRFRNSPIDQIRGTSGRQDDKLFLRGPLIDTE
ncbi:MAG: hypothetical protein CME06_05760 [Gemmatimonadetes bacterium]|nr:hypothetical protein [Gemmatimonadota bacterium]